jgi:gliding motility-associated-like protein
LIKPAFYITIILLSFVFKLQAQQNLVLNGDFGDYSSCPQGFSDPSQNPKEIEKCIGWKPASYGTSDYYNACATNPLITVPNNGFGEQTPFNGNGYLGGYATNYNWGAGYDGYSGIMWWEYVQGQLLTPLESGKIYKFSMEISLAEGSDLMITELGVYFSAGTLLSQNTAALTFAPQCIFYNPDYFQDTLNWVHLETLFIAGGGEQNLTIGNFRNNILTDTLRRYDLSPFGENPLITYIYYDNIVLTDATDGIDVPNIFTPNGDGINDLWKLPFSGGDDKTVTIMNRWGNVVYASELNGFNWDGKGQGQDVSDGVYFYRISNTNIAGFIEMVR